MDKHNLNALSNMLFAELLIGAIFYKLSSELTVLAIKKYSACRMYSEEYIVKIINDLISYGLIIPHIRSTTGFTYSITKFGLYYYDKLSNENSDINAMMIQIEGEFK